LEPSLDGTEPGPPDARRKGETLVARKDAEVLAGVPLFSGLSKRHLRRIADLTEAVAFPAGATIATEGEPGDTFYVITEGRARVRRGGRTVARLGVDDFFGEVSLIDGGPRTASVEAQEDIRALALHRAEFRRMLEREPAVVVRILSELALRLRQAERPLIG
jgi:CRP/FNR family transcriptional regulator, cyclic AMP receptor protein